MHAPDYLAGRLVSGQRQTLEPLRRTLDHLGHPENAVPVVLIGGTNGKGSTQAFLASILRAAGYRTGVFTSPSLEDFHELIQIDGRPIAPALARPLADEVLEAAGPDGLTLFEAATALAFLAFERSGIDLAVAEVGLGGRQDATNLSDPIVSIITRVALDHTAELGGSLEAIAAEKVGIARPGRPLVTGADGRALEGIEAFCRRIGAPVDRLGREFFLEPGPDGLLFHDAAVAWSGIKLGLRGTHQHQNAALAIQAARRLEAAGFVVGAEAVREGLRTAWLPGRLEWLEGPEGLRVLVDGAHNPDGAAALARALAGLELPRPRVMALAVYADKDLEGMLRALAPEVDRLICTRTTAPRCLPPEEIAAQARAVLDPALPIEVVPTVSAAIERFRQLPAATHLVTGSLSVVAEARRAVCGE